MLLSHDPWRVKGSWHHMAVRNKMRAIVVTSSIWKVSRWARTMEIINSTYSYGFGIIGNQQNITSLCGLLWEPRIRNKELHSEIWPNKHFETDLYDVPWGANLDSPWDRSDTQKSAQCPWPVGEHMQTLHHCLFLSFPFRLLLFNIWFQFSGPASAYSVPIQLLSHFFLMDFLKEHKLSWTWGSPQVLGLF